MEIHYFDIIKYIALNLLRRKILFFTTMISLVLPIFVHINPHEYVCNNCKNRLRIKFHKIIYFHEVNYRKLNSTLCGL